MKLPVIITDAEDGYYVVQVPVIPGCISQGKTREEDLANIKKLPCCAWRVGMKRAGRYRENMPLTKLRWAFSALNLKSTQFSS